jgi:hypothetical protein
MKTNFYASTKPVVHKSDKFSNSKYSLILKNTKGKSLHKELITIFLFLFGSAKIGIDCKKSNFYLM